MEKKFNSKYAAPSVFNDNELSPEEQAMVGIDTPQEAPEEISTDDNMTEPEGVGGTRSWNSKWWQRLSPKEQEAFVTEKARKFAPQMRTTVPADTADIRKPQVTKSPMFVSRQWGTKRVKRVAPGFYNRDTNARPSARGMSPMVRLRGPVVRTIEKIRRRTPEEEAAYNRQSQELANRPPDEHTSNLHQMKAAITAMEIYHRTVYPCKACGGAFNGGHEIAPIGQEHTQKYCKRCENSGVDPDAQTDRLTDLHSYARRYNEMVAYHEQNCNARGCAPDCSLDDPGVRHKQGCHLDQGTGKWTCSKDCKVPRTLGAITRIRNMVQHAGKKVERYHTHARAGSSDEVLNLTAPRGVVDDYKPIARSFELMGGKENAPLRPGTPITFFNHDTTNPDGVLPTKYEPHKVYQPGQYGIPTRSQLGFIKKPSLDDVSAGDAKTGFVMKYKSEEDPKFLADTEYWKQNKFPDVKDYGGDHDNPEYKAHQERYEARVGEALQKHMEDHIRDTGFRSDKSLEEQYDPDARERNQNHLLPSFQDKQMFGAITHVSADGKMARAVIHGTNLKSIRHEYWNRTKGEYGDLKHVKMSPKMLFNPIKTEDENSEQFNTRKGLQKVLGETFAKHFDRGRFGQRSPVRNGTWVVVEAPVEHFARISNRTAPILTNVGQIRTTNKGGGKPWLVTYRKSHNLSEDEFKRGMIETPNNLARQEMYNLARRLDSARGLNPGDRESLTPKFDGSIVEAVNRSRDTLSSTRQQNKKINAGDLEIPKGESQNIEMEMPEAIKSTGKIQDHQVNRAIEGLKQSSINERKRELTPDEEKTARDAIVKENHPSAGYRALGFKEE